MKKYLYIFKSELMTSLQYIIDNLFGFIGFVIMIFIFFNVWNYIYDDPSEIINGYTKNQMIWYVVITEIIWYIMAGRRFLRRIVIDVKGGNIAYNITKPYSYIGYLFSSHLGNCCIRFILYSFLGLLTGYLFLGSFPNISLQGIICVLISILLALFINILIVIFIGLFSFIIEDSTPFYWVYSKLILVLGTLFPIEYFPDVIGRVLSKSPIYVVSYGPAKLFVDYSFNSFISIIEAQLIYLVVSLLLCILVYNKGVKKLNVNGG